MGERKRVGGVVREGIGERGEMRDKRKRKKI